MKLISFAWTTAPLLAGAKTMTWREWADTYAATFKPGEIVQAWDKLPRSHGKRIGTIKIISVDHCTTADFTDEDYDAEGLAWLYAHPESCPKTLFGQKFEPYMASREMFQARRLDAEPGYLIRFEWLGLWP